MQEASAARLRVTCRDEDFDICTDRGAGAGACNMQILHDSQGKIRSKKCRRSAGCKGNGGKRTLRKPGQRLDSRPSLTTHKGCHDTKKL